MKLNFEIICDCLQEVYPLQRFGESLDALHIVSPRFYNGESDTDYIYMIDDQKLPAALCAPAIWICREDREIQEPSYPLAVIRGDVSTAEVMNALLAVFERFQNWEASLQECVDQHLNLRELAGRGARQIGCRILISDRRLMILADSHFYNDSADALENYEGQLIPADVVRIFSDSSDANRKQRVPYFDGEEGQYEGCRVYNINICFGDRYEGACSLMEEGRAFRRSDFALFAHFFQYAYKQFQFFYGTLGKQNTALRSVLKTLLEQREPDVRLASLLAPYEGIGGGYYCLIVDSRAGAELPAEYICFTIERLFSGSIGLIHENRAAAFIPEWKDADMSTFCMAMEPLQVGIGLSSPGAKICEFRQRYLQACAALELGCRKAPAEKVHSFDTYRLDYLLDRSLGDFAPEDFKTAGFRRLERLNEKSSVDYVHTLQVYLDLGMNSSEAARQLYLHRSSFLKRLDALREVLGDELETPEGRFMLYWQLYMTQRS